MSEQQPEKKKKPGFFSRMFQATDVESPAEAANAPLTEEAEPVSQVSVGPEGFDNSPVIEEEQDSKIPFARYFGWGKKKKSEEEQPPTPPPAEPTPATAERRDNWFNRLRSRLQKGSGSFVTAIRSAVGLSGRLDDDTVEKLEEILIAADVGMETAVKIVEKMRKRARAEGTEGADAIMALFKEVLTEVFEGNVRGFEPKHPDGPYVVMVVGVNGVGKTTTIGKMAKRCQAQGLKTMVVAGDTFRAAAIEQLEIWAQRTGSVFIKGKQGSDPSGLAFDAMNAAKARGIDVVFIDTAGRLQTKTSLMEELGKIGRVCKKVIPDAPHETLLVIDATTGQNAVSQVKAFTEIAPLTGLVMTKLDGTAKGGVLITIRDLFDVPVSLIGVGEGVDDLRDFDPEEFSAALFSDEKVYR